MRDIVVLLGDPCKVDRVKLNGKFNPEDLEVVERLKQSLKELKEYNFTYLNDHDHLFSELIELKGLNRIDYILNLCDEGFNNDLKLEVDIPLRLDELEIKYTGASAECLKLCFNKKKVKEIARKNGVIVAADYRLDDKISFPVIVKPSEGDGSFGINKKSVVKNRNELVKAVRRLKKVLNFDEDILIEEFIPGDELTQGIIGNDLDFIVLPLIKEDYSRLPGGLPEICGYEAKWDQESPYWKNLESIPAQVGEKTREIIQKCSVKLFGILECKDYARFDWRLDGSGTPKLLEVNPNPGWCDDGHLAKAARIAGIPYSSMLKEILKTAEGRFGFRNQKNNGAPHVKNTALKHRVCLGS